MPIVVSPHFYNPEISKIASNLATAIYGDPEARMKGDYYQSVSEENRANARKYNAEADLTGGRYRAQQEMTPDAMATLAPLPGETPVQHAMRVAPLMSSIARYGANAKDIADGTGSTLSNLWAMGGDNDKRTSMAMQGHATSDDYAGTTERADQILKTKGDQKYKQETGVANIKAKADRDVASIQGDSALARLFATPISVSPGENAFLAPGDPRFGKVGDAAGVVRGAPSKISVEGEVGQRKLHGERGSVLDELWAGRAGAPAAPKSHMVSGRGVQDALLAAASMVPGATSTAMTGKRYFNPDFEASFPADKAANARTALGAELGRSGNVQSAAQAYLAALGLKPGDRFKPSSGFLDYAAGGKDFWGYGSIEPGSAIGDVFANPGHPASPAPPASPAAPAAPVVQSAAQLPPPAARKVGMTITTSKGDMMWNGQGWVPAGAAY